MHLFVHRLLVLDRPCVRRRGFFGGFFAGHQLGQIYEFVKTFGVEYDTR